MNGSDVRERLSELGFDEDESKALSTILKAADAAMEGDAFSQARLNNLEEEDQNVLAAYFERNGFEQTADKLESSVSVYRPLYSFYEDEVMQR